jgi:hypothetical protein
MIDVGVGLEVLARALVAAVVVGFVFENGRGLRETLSGRRLCDATGDGGDGEGCSLRNVEDTRRGSRGDVAAVELVVDDTLGVVEIVPEQNNQNFIVCLV